jgi:hypothetical protein
LCANQGNRSQTEKALSLRICKEVTVGASDLIIANISVALLTSEICNRDPKKIF